MPWHYNELQESCSKFREDLKRRLSLAIENGWNTFLTGMALGIDTIFAEVILELKKQHKNIKLIAVIPCKNQCERWQAEQQKRYGKIVKKCDAVIYISDTYTPTCMNDRNKYLIDHSSACIAVWDGSPSGTGNTVKYAQASGCKVRILNPNSYI